MTLQEQIQARLKALEHAKDIEEAIYIEEEYAARGIAEGRPVEPTIPSTTTPIKIVEPEPITESAIIPAPLTPLGIQEKLAARLEEISKQNKPKPMPKPKPSEPSQSLSVSDAIKAKLAASLHAPKISLEEKQDLENQERPGGDLNLFDKQGNRIWLDESQQHAVDKARTGHSFTLIGNAGTGKTTTNQAIVLTWLKHHRGIIKQTLYRIKGTGEYWDGSSIAICAWTNQATNNMKRTLLTNPTIKDEFGSACNITTIHNLLEYTRDTITVIDEETGQEIEKLRYFPQRDASYKLDITHLILEEGSTVSVGRGGLWNELEAALPAECQVIILGDICQLPPVGGKSILSYALLELPVIELTTVHRQALDNPIIRQAYNVLRGLPIETDMIEEDGEQRGVLIYSGNSKIKTPTYKIKQALRKTLPRLIEEGRIVPGESIILNPYNKLGDGHIGVSEINNVVGTYLAHKDDKEVYEIKAGIRTLYLSVGDQVIYNKNPAVVTKIRYNPSYTGIMPADASKTMDYWGHDTDFHKAIDGMIPGIEDMDLDKIAAIDYSNLSLDEDGEKLAERAASHVITIEYGEDGSSSGIIELSRAGELSDANFYLGYALTVHKAQGSEWKTAVFIIHDSNAVMLFREMLYTAMTRPRELLIIIGQEHTINKMIHNPRIKGNTLKDKIEFFNGTDYLDAKVNIPKGYNLSPT